jgi:hypothetical protein
MLCNYGEFYLTLVVGYNKVPCYSIFIYANYT